MDEAMAGKSPLLVVGWLGRTGYQTVIHEAARQAAQAGKVETKSQQTDPRPTEPKRP